MVLNCSSWPSLVNLLRPWTQHFTASAMLRHLIPSGVGALALNLLLRPSQSITVTVCKSTPDSPSWPHDSQWQALNDTINGRLLTPPPPAAVCHSEQPTYNPFICETTDWANASTYTNDPLGIICPNWSKDSCLPQPKYPCTGEGFPVYVINATCAEHVAAGIDFARKHNIRLNVKGSGHDYLGRSVALRDIG